MHHLLDQKTSENFTISWLLLALHMACIDTTTL